VNVDPEEEEDAAGKEAGEKRRKKVPGAGTFNFPRVVMLIDTSTRGSTRRAVHERLQGTRSVPRPFNAPVSDVAGLENRTVGSARRSRWKDTSAADRTCLIKPAAAEQREKREEGT
jgi:hypothetical protein